MKYKNIAFLLVFLFVCGTQAQTITKRVKQYCLFSSADARVGQEFFVYRNINSQDTKVGYIKIVKVQNTSCIGQIVLEKPGTQVKAGDYLIGQTDDLDTMFGLSDNAGPSQQPVQGFRQASYQRKSMFTPMTVTAGLICGGLSYYFHTQANDKYKEYEDATAPDYTATTVEQLYDDTIKLDDQAKLFGVIGGALVGVGVAKMLFFPDPQPTRYAGDLDFYPTIGRRATMLNVKLHF